MNPFPSSLRRTAAAVSLCFPFLAADLAADDVQYQVSRPEIEFKIFQFPRDAMPRIDGKTDDWQMVPDSYAYDTSLLSDTEYGHGTDIDPDDLDVKVTVGWVKGLNRLYFLYEAHDDFWDFGRFSPHGYLNDILEIVVDGDMSGGSLIFNPLLDRDRMGDKGNPDFIENYTRYSGNHAQNYHIYTPPVNNAWVLVWGGQSWISEFPYSNYAYAYDFEPGESGNLVLEFWITPYDYAPSAGPQNAVESQLQEDQLIGVGWSILDFDGGDLEGHINLPHNANMVHDASLLCAFRLMPIEEHLQPDLYAEWTYQFVDRERRVVAFQDESIGEIASWKWDFGDGRTSTEQHPIHTFDGADMRTVITLEVNGPHGVSRRTRYWDVLVK